MMDNNALIALLCSKLIELRAENEELVRKHGHTLHELATTNNALRMENEELRAAIHVRRTA